MENSHVAEQLQAFTAGADLIGLIGHAQANAAKHPDESFGTGGSIPPHLAPLALATAPDASNAVSNDGRSRWGWLTATVLTPLFLLAGVLLTIELQKGQLVIESDAANVSVSLLKDGQVYQQLRIEPGVNSTRLYAGKYQVEIDSGSDAVQIDDKQFTIQKGETTIARVTTVDAKEPTATPVVALPESELLPVTQSMEREILELEIEREDLLATLGKDHPKLAPVERRLKLMREFADRSGKSTNATKPPASQLLFEGKTLRQWLDVLAHDRSPGAIAGALTAVGALMLPESRQQVSDTLLRILPTLDGEMKINRVLGSVAVLDSVAFALLERATPAAEYYPMLASECERSQDLKWTSRIIQSWQYVTADAAPTALVDWLQSNVFESAERPPLLDEASTFYATLLLGHLTPLEPSLEDRMVKTLEECQFLGNDFWLDRFYVGATDSDHRLTAPGEKFAARVCLHAIAALDDEETQPQYVVQAIMVLEGFRGIFARLVGDEGSARLETALRRRLVAMSTSDERLFELAELNSPFAASEVNGPIPIQPSYSFTVTTDRADARVASVAIALLRFAKDLDIGLTFNSELNSIYQATVPLSRDLYLSLVEANPYQNRRVITHLLLRWPALIVGPEPWRRFSVEPTQKHWLATIIRTEALRALPADTSERLQAEEDLATKLAWTQSRFAQFDSDMDEKFSEEEFFSFAKELKLNVSFQRADKDDNKSLSVEELFEYLESGGATLRRRPTEATSAATSNELLDLAKRTIGKYDLNSDGELSPNEWERIFINPTAADTNNDGVITAEEYAAFREKE